MEDNVALYLISENHDVSSKLREELILSTLSSDVKFDLLSALLKDVFYVLTLCDETDPKAQYSAKIQPYYPKNVRSEISLELASAFLALFETDEYQALLKRLPIGKDLKLRVRYFETKLKKFPSWGTARWKLSTEDAQLHGIQVDVGSVVDFHGQTVAVFSIESPPTEPIPKSVLIYIIDLSKYASGGLTEECWDVVQCNSLGPTLVLLDNYELFVNKLLKSRTSVEEELRYESANLTLAKLADFKGDKLKELVLSMKKVFKEISKNEFLNVEVQLLPKSFDGDAFVKKVTDLSKQTAIPVRSPKPREFDLYLSHDWGEAVGNKFSTHERVKAISLAMQKAGITVWLDENEMERTTNVAQAVAQGLSESKFVVVFLTRRYIERVRHHDTNISQEFLSAVSSKGLTYIIPVVLEAELMDAERWGMGTVYLKLSNKFRLDMSSDDKVFDMIKEIKKYIERVSNEENTPKRRTKDKL